MEANDGVLAEFNERRYCPHCEQFLTHVHTIVFDEDTWNPIHVVTHYSDKDWTDHFRFVGSCPAKS